MMHLRTAVLIPILLLAGSTFSFGQVAEGSFERTLKVSGEVTLDVSTGFGRIEVHPGPVGAVAIRARVRASDNWFAGGGAAERVRRVEQNPPIEQSGNSIRIGRVGDRDLYSRVSISYDITVPEATHLTASSGSGAIQVEGLEGSAHVTTGSGSIEFGDIGGTVEARTGSGHIVGRGLGAGVVARTGSGSVTLRVGQNAAFALSARSGSGGIEVAHPMTMQGRVNRHRVAATVRGGGPLVEVSTGSGAVRID